MSSKENILGSCGHPKHENDPIVNEDAFTWKGCWGCHHFSWKDPKPLLDVKEASELVDVSKSTIRRWIRQGKLEGRMFVQGRETSSLPASRKYLIRREDFEEFVEEKNMGLEKKT